MSHKVLFPASLVVMLAVSSAAQAPIGDIVSGDAAVRGDVVPTRTGTRLTSGSSVSAGQTPATLRLARGGEIRICPRSRVSLTNSQSGRDLVIGMGTGAIEAHYSVRATADTVLTPDFRILLAGPANFSVAIGADARGNTCVRSLDGNTGSILITEMMGDGVYQVLPGDQVYLRNGSVANANRTVPPDCGCPQSVAVMTAQLPETPAPAAPQPQDNTPQQHSSPATQQQKVELPANSPEAILAAHGAPVPAPQSPTDGTVPSPNGEIHVQIDAPFVYNASDSAPPPPIVARLSLGAMPDALQDQSTALPPGPIPARGKSRASRQSASGEKTEHKGFFGHVRSFFASIFK